MVAVDADDFDMQGRQTQREHITTVKKMSEPTPTPAAVAPAKIPVKIPIMGLAAPGAVKLMVKLPPGGVAIKIPPPKPAAAPVATPAAVATTASKKNVRARNRDSDDDDDTLTLLGGNGRTAVAAPSVTKVKTPAPAAVTKTQQAPPRQARRIERPPTPTSSSSSSEEDDDDEEGVSLFKLAQTKGYIPQENVEELLKEEVKLPTGPPPRPPVQKRFSADIDGAIERLRARLVAEEAKARIKDDNKTVSLGTSKVNYIDPRIICSWCKREKLSLSKVFSATLQKKFPWARDIQEDYEF